MKAGNMVWSILAATLLMSTSVSAKGQGDEIKFYTVLPGDTLDGIALELGVTVANLIEWNGDGVGELYVGTHIRAKGVEDGHLRTRAHYTLKSGETFSEVGERFALSEMQLRVLNPEYGEEKEPESGALLLVLPKVRSRRIGVDTAGESFWSKIRDPEWLGATGLGYRVKNERNVWGTRETIQLLKLAFKRVALTFPGTEPFVVGDISRKRGGRFHPHLSHKTGMDIDLSYAFLDNQPRTRFEVATRKTMDAEKSWEFLRALLETGHTQYAFIDHRLQKPLYHQALASGVSKEVLEEVFQYPRSRYTKKGIIRHTRGHKNHIHLRFGFKKKYLSKEAMSALKNAGENPIVQLPGWVQGIFA